MFFLKRLKQKREHKIVVVCEFMADNKAEKLIANLSNYIYSFIRNDDIILTDLQRFPSGYRLTYNITYIESIFLTFRKRHYTKELSKLGSWLYTDSEFSGYISKYNYNYN